VALHVADLAESLDDGAEEPPPKDAEDGGKQQDQEKANLPVLDEEKIDGNASVPVAREDDDDEKEYRAEGDDLRPDFDLEPGAVHKVLVNQCTAKGFDWLAQGGGEEEVGKAAQTWSEVGGDRA